MSVNTGYIHALRFSTLSALYDPIGSLTSREQRFRSALLDGVALKPGSACPTSVAAPARWHAW